MRAADLIGQLADINYLRRQTALFDEFRETGMSDRLGFSSLSLNGARRGRGAIADSDRRES